MPLETPEFLPFPLDRPTPIPYNFYRELNGGSLICCMIMLVLYGVSVLQTYLYYLNYPNDRRLLKVLVLLLSCVSTLHAIFACKSDYDAMILTYNDPLLLLVGNWSSFMMPGVGVVICFLVQSFYARMIYQLTRDKWRWFLTTILVVLILMQVGFGIFAVVGEFREQDISKLPNISRNGMVPTFTARAVSDLVTALSLCILLGCAQAEEYMGSARLVHTLLIYAVSRFLLTTVVVFVQVIVLICWPASTWAMIIEIISAHLYVNSCLATLNSRNHLRNINDSSMESPDFRSGDGMEFRQPESRATGGGRSSVNVDLNNTKAVGSMKDEVDGYVKSRKLDDNSSTSVV